MILYRKRKILKKHDMSLENREDYIAVEKILTVFLNGKELLHFSCTPSMIRELVIGFLITEGFLQESFSLKKIKLQHGKEIRADIKATDNRITKGMIATRCLGGITVQKAIPHEKVHDDFTVSAEDIQTIFHEFHQKSELFKLTGCFHSAALSDGKRILAFAEDIGRHNAVDKVIGYSLTKDISFNRKMMLVSCRLSSEIVSKCARWRIPIIASRAAPTDLAISIAEKSGITLVGFVRENRFNVYGYGHRITN